MSGDEMLVDYDSDDDRKKIIVELATDEEVAGVRKRPSERTGSLASLLPPPKRSKARAPTSAPLIPSSVKHGGAKEKSVKSAQEPQPMFSIATPDRPAFKAGQRYAPILAEPKQSPEEAEQEGHEGHEAQEVQTEDNGVDGFGLDEAGRQIMMGRRHRPVQMQEFDVSKEYDANQYSRQAPAVQPIRSIGAGRHHIRTLLNAVHNQRESFEETFAQNRQKKKDAGARYGF